MAVIEVEVDLDDFDTEELIAELEMRGMFVSEEDPLIAADIAYDYENVCEALENIYNLRKQGLDYNEQLDALFENHLGL